MFGFILRRLWEAGETAEGQPVVGVVGAAHVKGIAKRSGLSHVSLMPVSCLSHACLVSASCLCHVCLVSGSCLSHVSGSSHIATVA